MVVFSLLDVTWERHWRWPTQKISTGWPHALWCCWDTYSYHLETAGYQYLPHT